MNINFCKKITAGILFLLAMVSLSGCVMPPGGYSYTTTYYTPDGYPYYSPDQVQVVYNVVPGYNAPLYVYNGWYYSDRHCRHRFRPCPSPAPYPYPGPGPCPMPVPVPGPGPCPMPVPVPGPGPCPMPVPVPGPGPCPVPVPGPGPAPMPGPCPVPTPRPAPRPIVPRTLPGVPDYNAKRPIAPSPSGLQPGGNPARRLLPGQLGQ